MSDKTKDQNKNSIDDKINALFTADKIKAFQDDIKKDLGQSETKKAKSGTKKIPDFAKVETRGRKNKGLTQQHRKERNEYRNTLLNTSNIDSFNTVEHVQGEIITDDIDDFKELYQLTCESVLDKFKSDNEELTKKHPYIWYKKLLIELKKNVPFVSYKDIDKLEIVWDCLTWLLNDIGLYITFETFSLFTRVYKYQLEKMESVNPKYIDFRKKIINERDDALKNEILYSPYNSTNKIFMAKVNGIVEKTEPKQIEITHSIRQYDNLPMFSQDLNEISKDQ